MIAMTVIDRVGRKTLLLIGSVRVRAEALREVAAVFFSNSHEELLVWLLIGFIAFFSFSQGRGDLGVHRRSVPHARNAPSGQKPR